MRPLDRLLIQIGLVVLFSFSLNYIQSLDWHIPLSIFKTWSKMSGLKVGDKFPQEVEFGWATD